ncbi:MAG: ABC transporter ATP-binding protein [Bacillota bacterium]|nr:ABC transporter ATP-binding protein [Bacillota bacterium]
MQLYSHQFTAITGPNGSGKTTLGKLMTGILKPSTGQVLICGKDSRAMTLGEIGSKIGYLFQNPSHQLFATSVKEEISFVLELKGCTKEEIDRKVKNSLETFHLLHLKESLPFKLSRGEKQRLAIAAVLINEPGFLVLDEPTTGLDMDRRKVLAGILEELRQKGIGMAVISHDQEFVKRHSDRIIKMSGGEIVEDCR